MDERLVKESLNKEEITSKDESENKDKFLSLENIIDEKMKEVQREKYMHNFKGHTDVIFSVAISQDNRFLVSGSKDQSIKI